MRRSAPATDSGSAATPRRSSGQFRQLSDVARQCGEQIDPDAILANLPAPADFERLLREKYQPILSADDYARLREVWPRPGYRRRGGRSPPRTDRARRRTRKGLPVSTCAFCDLAYGRAAAVFVNTWPDALAIRPLNPVAPGHVLVLPRRHVADATTDPDVTAATMR
jgi:hypothetical protein